MVSDGSVTRLIQLLRTGDREERDLAARLIWERYFRDLLELARNNLNRRIRRREDEEDVLQSMYKSFCLRQQRGEFDLAGRDALWKLLVTITLRKARNAANKQAMDKRDIARERTLPAGDETRSPHWALEQMDAAGPSPAEAAVLNEALERRLEVLADPELRQTALFGWRDTPTAKSPTFSTAPSAPSSASLCGSAACGHRTTTVEPENYKYTQGAGRLVLNKVEPDEPAVPAG